MAKPQYVVLDRDGTLIYERHYLSEVDQVELLPGAIEGLRQFVAMGLQLVVVTNQSGISRGYFDEERLGQIHQRLRSLLAAEGITLAGIYHCPHHPDDGCHCRKPAPGMLQQAALDLDFELSQCIVIGDKPCDIALGQAVGATTVLVRTGYGAEVATQGTAQPDYVVQDLRAAADTLTPDRVETYPMTVDALKLDPMTSSAVLQQTVKTHLLASAELKKRVAHECSASVVAAAQLMAEALLQGGKVLLCGNGGSAADCQHIAGELVNWLNKDFQRPGLPAIALTADSSILTAIANDSSFEQIFERQVQALGRPGDVLLGISTSGNSDNVVRAVRAAKTQEIGTVALTGAGGRLGDLADVAIQVPDHNTQRIQESHLAIEHMLCALVEVYLFSEKRK